MTAIESEIVRTGELVRLRVKNVDDAERDFEWRRDPELAAYDAARPLRVSFSTFVSTMSEELRYPTSHRRTFAIEDIETGTHIGNVMYYGYDPREHEAELGITIGNRDYWSRGYGTDAVRTLVDYAFSELGLERMYLHTLAWNYRAQRCFEHAGFKRVRHVNRGGHEFILMDITEDEIGSL